MKKLLIMSIALVAIMATVFTVSAFAANTVTIGENITVAKYYDAEGNFNDAYAVVTVPFEASEGVERLTFYFAAQALSSALEGEEAKVIYIDEQVKPETGSVTFVIEKARVLTAANATAAEGSSYTNATVEAFELTFKLGGTDVDVADSKTVVYNNPTLYGDVDGNGAIKAYDASMIISAAVKAETLTAEETIHADVDGNGAVKAYDASLAISVAVKNMTYAELLSEREWAY